MRYWEAMYLRADPPEDSEAELATLRDARLAAIPADWGHYGAILPPHTADTTHQSNATLKGSS
jgi:hypothetical protein